MGRRTLGKRRMQQIHVTVEPDDLERCDALGLNASECSRKGIKWSISPEAIDMYDELEKVKKEKEESDKQIVEYLAIIKKKDGEIASMKNEWTNEVNSLQDQLNTLTKQINELVAKGRGSSRSWEERERAPEPSNDDPSMVQAARDLVKKRYETLKHDPYKGYQAHSFFIGHWEAPANRDFLKNKAKFKDGEEAWKYCEPTNEAPTD